MHNHAPQNYICPLCLAIDGTENEETMMKQDDIFYRDQLVVAAINSKFIDNNPGHVIVFPVKHYEHIYDLPDNIGNQINKVAKQIALAMKKTRDCDGVMILQNNEPASGQHAFHYHMHVFPRLENDQILQHMNQARVSSPAERISFSEKMKRYFSTITI